MSHFSVMVIVGNDAGSVEEEVERLLAPYDENLEVDPYEKECDCVGSRAYMEANEAFLLAYPKHRAEQERSRKAMERFQRKLQKAAGPEFAAGMFADLGEQVDACIAEGAPAAKLEPLRADEETAARRWFRLHKRVDKFMDRYLPASAHRYAPAPDCEECEGRGHRVSTWNEEGRWDFWMIGGRWAGFFDDYDPTMDPKNKEKCIICGGKGKVSENDGSRKKIDCFHCSGTGVAEKWPTGRTFHPGDIQPLADVRERLGSELASYAIITPDGKWQSRGEAGAFGFSHGEVSTDVWRKRIAEIVAGCDDDHKVAIVDYHV